MLAFRTVTYCTENEETPVSYESAKAVAAIPLSTKIFNRENARLSAEWEQVKKSLGLAV